jgi:hypothetical protein
MQCAVGIDIRPISAKPVAFFEAAPHQIIFIQPSSRPSKTLARNTG